MSFHYQLENGSGALVLESGNGDYLLEQIIGSARVQAVSPGQCNADYKDVGDVFDIKNTGDFSDSTVSQVPVGNPIYPIYGWMLSVPASTPLFSWAAFGNSSPKSGVYQPNKLGVVNLSIPTYVE